MPELYPVNINENLVVIAHTLPSLLEGGVCAYQGEELLLAAFIIEDGILREIRPLIPSGEQDPAPEPGWRSIVLPPRQFLVPAFVDCHLHLALDGVAGFRTFTTPPPSHLLLARLRALAAAGVLAIRDGGDQYGTAFNARHVYADASLKEPLPKIVATGPALFRSGRYGAKLGGEGLDGLGELESEIKRRKAAGAQQLKVILSGLVSLQERGKVGPLQFSTEELQTIVRHAAAFELPVMAHASSDAAVRTAVRAGVHSVEHGYYLTEESLHEMAAAGVVWVPTIAPLAALTASLAHDSGDSPQSSDYAGNQHAAVLGHAVNQHLIMLDRARTLGVSVAVGTDGGAPGVSWSEGYWMELKLLAQAGFAPNELLTLATVNGAHLLGLSKEQGFISVGKRPSWLCLDMDFLAGHIQRNTLKGIFFPCRD